MPRRREAPPGSHYPPQYSGFENPTSYYSTGAGSSPTSSAYRPNVSLTSTSQSVWQPSYQAYQPMSPGDFLNSFGGGVNPYGPFACSDIDSGFGTDASNPPRPQQYGVPYQRQTTQSPPFQNQPHYASPQCAQPIPIPPGVSRASAAMYRAPTQFPPHASPIGFPTQTGGFQNSGKQAHTLGPYNSRSYQPWQEPQTWNSMTPSFGSPPVVSSEYLLQQAAQQMQQYSANPTNATTQMQYSLTDPRFPPRADGAPPYEYLGPPADATEAITPAGGTSGGAQSLKPKPPPEAPALHDGKYRKEFLVAGRVETRIKLQNGELAVPTLGKICRQLAVLVNPHTGRLMFPDMDIQEAKTSVLQLIGDIESRPPKKYEPTSTWDGWAKKIRNILAEWDEIARTQETMVRNGCRILGSTWKTAYPSP